MQKSELAKSNTAMLLLQYIQPFAGYGADKRAIDLNQDLPVYRKEENTVVGQGV